MKPVGVRRSSASIVDNDGEDVDASDAEINDVDGAAAPSPISSRTFSVQPKCASKIHKLLDVQRYSNRWPKIPKHELFASSIHHPYVPEWRWLLHTKRLARYSGICYGDSDDI